MFQGKIFETSIELWGDKLSSNLDSLLDEIRNFVRSKLRLKDPHGTEHVERVLKICKYLLRVEGGDPWVVYPAALLHDIEREKEKHAKRSADTAKEFLIKIGFPREKINLIVKAIREHSYSSGLRPSFKESEILSDADKLDALGAIGIARVFMDSALKGRDIKESIRHFYDKILKLPDLMCTKAGRRLALSRVKIVKKFLVEMENEFEFLYSIEAA
ncbi:phosphohydrolase [Candidatus Geothermarchaeota archaeon]|nr:MAG: phosphohydrolase [Candidatus Geothermarchaeota archaeon]